MALKQLLNITLGLLVFLVCVARVDAYDASNTDASDSIIKNDITNYPLTYRPEPIGFKSESWGYRPLPGGYREKPIQYHEVPLNYRAKIATDIGLPRGYSPNPPNYIERENHPLVNTNPANVISIDANPLTNHGESLRITPDNHPGANKKISLSKQKAEDL